MASGRLIDYLGYGLLADRPATPTLHSGVMGLWWSTDTNTMSIWDGSTWSNITATAAPDAVTAVSSSSGALTIDCSLGKSFTVTLTENITSITLSNTNGAGFATEVDIQFTQDGTGGRTVTLPASFKALGGSDTAVASGANAVTVLSAKTFDNGTTWRYAMQESA